MTVRRWKILTTLLALSTLFFAVRGRSAGEAGADSAGKVDRAAVPTTNALALRQLRIPAAALGLREDNVVRQLKAARSAREATMLCEKLGFIGTDYAVDALSELVDDRRPGVSGAALAAIGHIGTSRGTRFLLKLEESGTVQQRASVISALGRTNADSARERLLDLVADVAEVHRSSAAYALGEIGGDDVVRHLEALAHDASDSGFMSSLVYSISRIGTTSANDALVALSKSPNRRLRNLALGQLGGKSENHGTLLATLESTDAQSVAAAAQALGNARSKEAVPKLIKLSKAGSYSVRNAAINALGQIGGADAIEQLGTLVNSRDGSAYMAGMALGTIGTDEARAVLIDAAMTGSGDRNSLMSALRSLRGPDIDAAMLTIAETGKVNERYSAVGHLITVGAPGAIKLAARMATSGQAYQRQNAIRLLGQAGTSEAREALKDIAESASGPARVAALEALGGLGDDEAGGALLVESLTSGTRNEASAAARALVNLGTQSGRDAILAALASEEGPSSQAAAMVLNQLGNDPKTREALIAASEKNPAIRDQVMRKLLSSGADEGIELARSAIEGDDVSRATSAVYALGNAAGEDVSSLLDSAVSSGNASVRASAASALAQRGDEHATEALSRLVSDSEASVRSSALHSLGRIGSDEAVDALISASSGTDVNDRRAAATALGTSGTERANDRIIDLLRDADDSVAMAAIWATSNGNRRTDGALRSMLSDTSRSDAVRAAVANQLRNRGARLSDSEKALVTELAGGGGGRGGRYNFH